MSDAMNREQARLILLINDFIQARRLNDREATKGATDALQEFALDTAFPNLATKANAAISVASIEDMQEGLRLMVDITDQLSPMRQAFQASTEIAKSGQASLFFPRVASSLVQAEEIINSLVTAASDFKDAIAASREDFDIAKVKELIGRVQSAGDELKGKLDALGA